MYNNIPLFLSCEGVLEHCRIPNEFFECVIRRRFSIYGYMRLDVMFEEEHYWFWLRLGNYLGDPVFCCPLVWSTEPPSVPFLVYASFLYSIQCGWDDVVGCLLGFCLRRIHFLLHTSLAYIHSTLNTPLVNAETSDHASDDVRQGYVLAKTTRKVVSC